MRIVANILALTILLSCSYKENRTIENSEIELANSDASLITVGNNKEKSKVEIFEGVSGSSIQQIEEYRDNIVFRITKIDTKSHLMRQGMSDKKAIESALSTLRNEQLFYVEFEDESKRNILKQEFQDTKYSCAIKYLSSQISKDFIAVCGNDTLKASFTNYEDNFHIAPFERLLLGFSEIDPAGSIDIIYKDKLFGKGTVIFSFLTDIAIDNNSDFVL